jgi:hypothetical protein
MLLTTRKRSNRGSYTLDHRMFENGPTMPAKMIRSLLQNSIYNHVQQRFRGKGKRLITRVLIWGRAPDRIHSNLVADGPMAYEYLLIGCLTAPRH